MSITVVTDQDVAIIPFEKREHPRTIHAPWKTRYGFSLKFGSYPFAAVLPLSQILDSSKKESCIDDLKNQFEHIPLFPIEDNFLKYNAAYTLSQSLFYKARSPEGIKNSEIKEMLPGFKSKTVAKVEPIIKDIRRIFGKQPHITQEEIDESHRKIEILNTILFKDIQEVLAKKSNAQKSDLASKIIAVVEKHHVIISGSGVQLPDRLTYTLEEMRTARELKNSPGDFAEFHYQGLLAKAKSSQTEPEKNIDDSYQFALKSALSLCPTGIAKCAQAMGIKIVVLPDDKNPLHLLRRGLSLTHAIQNFIANLEIGALSIDNIIVARANGFTNPYSLSEEIIHTVDSHVCEKDNPRPFSEQMAWKRAVSRDVEEGKGNEIYRNLVIDLQAFTIMKFPEEKANMGLNADGKSMPDIASTQGNPIYREALVDIYHIATMVDEALTEKHRIVIDGKVFTSRDDVMRAAFPNAWLLLDGPKKGNRLVQYPDGQIKEINARINGLSGTTKVTSMKEYAENYLEAAQEEHHHRDNWMTRFLGGNRSRNSDGKY